MHPRNIHEKQYNIIQLVKTDPELEKYIITNKNRILTINFSIPEAVKELNRALLMKYYDIEYWDIPNGYLCPPIPGRSDYIHYVADLIKSDSGIKKNKNIRCLDIGMGANCIYPIVGTKLYDWNFVGTDIDERAINSAQRIIDRNERLQDKVELRWQKFQHLIFETVVNTEDKFDITICNPPFYKSRQDAKMATVKKNKNLKSSISSKPVNNFRGKANELWCNGGERKFILNMIDESRKFSNQIRWFTTLVASKYHLNSFYQKLQSIKGVEYQTIEMLHGHKKSRILAWRYKS